MKPKFLSRVWICVWNRCVQLVDASLATLQSIYLKLGEHEANVATVTQKVQEQIDNDDIVITDSKGQEIMDTQGTQGLLVDWFVASFHFVTFNKGHYVPHQQVLLTTASSQILVIIIK